MSDQLMSLLLPHLHNMVETLPSLNHSQTSHELADEDKCQANDDAKLRVPFWDFDRHSWYPAEETDWQRGAVDAENVCDQTLDQRSGMGEGIGATILTEQEAGDGSVMRVVSRRGPEFEEVEGG